MQKKSKTKSLDDTAQYALVYSTDPIVEKHCPACSRQLSKCVCKAKLISSEKLSPAVRIERKGRGGKSVTVLTKLPADATFIKALLTYLKRAIGCGGTSYIEDGQGVIELQGERQKEVLELISKYK